MTTRSSIEILESRIAPAGIVGHTLFYTDTDGDHVSVTFSKPGIAASMFNFDAGGKQLQSIVLANLVAFEGNDITVKVAKVATGDGRVNIGYLNASGIDLGKISIPGDLGQIDAGANVASIKPAIQSLTLQSLGRLGLDTQAAGGSIQSNVNGPIGSLFVSGDVGGQLTLTGLGFGKINRVHIGGSLVGGAANNSGQINTSGDLGTVSIAGDIQGGSGSEAGLLSTNTKLARLTVGGSIVGGTGFLSGGVVFNQGGLLSIAHDVVGNTGALSGSLGTGSNPADTLTFLSIGGTLSGNTGNGSGSVFIDGNIGMVKIGHDLTGGSITGSAPSVANSGLIQSTEGRIGSVLIGGSIVSGIDSSNGGVLTNNATIRAHHDIGALVVRGSIIGHSTANGDSPVVISGGGAAVTTATRDSAIGSFTVGHRVEHAQILGGYDVNLTAIDGNAQIGAVKIGGDWIASTISAGVVNSGGIGHLGDGNGHDTLINAQQNSIARIANVIIGGTVRGSSPLENNTDHFAFTSHQIGLFRASGYSAPLAGTVDVALSALTGDVDLVEI